MDTAWYIGYIKAMACIVPLQYSTTTHDQAAIRSSGMKGVSFKASISYPCMQY